MKKLIRNKLTAVIAVLAMAFCMTGCGNREAGKGGDNTSAANEVISTDNDADVSDSVLETSYPVEIVDSNGDKITLESEPEKVVSVAPNLTELIYELDADDKLIGRSDYCDYPAEVSEVPSVGTLQTPDIETIISLDPDIVIVSTHFNEENTQKLSELGIHVITLYEESDMTGIYDIINILGTVVNRNTEADECVKRMKETIKSVEAAIDGLEAPTVYYVVGYGEYGDYTAGGDTFVGGLLTMAGGDNIAKEISGWNITLEEIVEQDPSIIIISEAMKDDFINSPNYGDLTAVKEGNVYTLDTNMLDRQGYRNAEGIKALAEIFHPEAFK